MKKIKLHIADYTQGTSSFFLDRLRQWYDVELTDTDPDYVFFYERATTHLRYPRAIRIFWTGENVSPDFNICDYAISFDECVFNDRHFRLPLYMVATCYSEKDKAAAGDLTFETVTPMTPEELAQKKEFCSFVYSNALADPRRAELFEKLSHYKQVRSGGKYLNNVGGPVPDKLLFEREHKFSIAFENSSRSGYTTEKLPAALAARTIPVYFGNPDIGKEFNTKRFINIHDYPNIDAVIGRIQALDTDDALYLSVVNQPVLADGFHYADTFTALDSFLRHIFDQPLDAARRRTINALHAAKLERRDRLSARYEALQSALRTVLAPLKKLRPLADAVRAHKQRALHKTS